MKYLLLFLVCSCAPEVSPMWTPVAVAELQGGWKTGTLMMVDGSDSVSAPLDTLLARFPSRVDLYAAAYLQDFQVKETKMICRSDIYGTREMILTQGESIEVYGDLSSRPAIKIDLLGEGKLRVRSVINEWSKQRHCIVMISAN